VQACSHESYCFDACCDVSLPVSDARSCSLEACLAKFTEHEALDTVYKCEQCKADTRKTKSIRLYSPPQTLILHLKRFSSRLEGASVAFGRRPSFSRMCKNSAAVNVPARLNIAPHCNPVGLRHAGVSGMYELVAVSEHSGGMGGGHYTATGRAVSDGNWYGFNDSSVSRASCPEGPSPSAYVLFYRMVPV
jgi:ubiquitin carboxyl-terminal hydrolase 4/11